MQYIDRAVRLTECRYLLFGSDVVSILQFDFD